MEYKKITQLAKGWSSYLWLVQDEYGKEYALKEVREKSPRKDLAVREGKMLLLANKAGVGPKAKEVNYEKNFVVMELVNGKKLLDWVIAEGFDAEVSREELYEFIKELYRQLLRLDEVHLSHNQLDVGKNILVEKKTDEKTGAEQYFPVVIDFEKATIKEHNHTKNIGQMESMLFYNPHGAVAKKIREKLGVYL